MRNFRLLHILGFSAVTLGVAFSTMGCPSSGGGGGGTGSPQWPVGSKKGTTALPSNVSWQGVYFISTPGTRGTMHLFTGSDEKIHGCWMAEDKHAKATFTGTVKDNLALFDWTEKKIGFAGAPTRITAYMVMDADPEGRHRVKGEYGADLSSDSGSVWEGIRQKNAEPKEDGCKIEEGETIPTETKPLD